MSALNLSFWAMVPRAKEIDWHCSLQRVPKIRTRLIFAYQGVLFL